MIQHIVLLNLREGYDAADLSDVMAGLGALDMDGFEHGPNRDFEAKSPNHPYGFMCTFADADALARYADDPAHHLLGNRLVAMCNGGGDGILVMDLDT